MRFSIACPSAKNSGIDTIENNSSNCYAYSSIKHFFKISYVTLAVPIGTVDLLIIILCDMTALAELLLAAAIISTTELNAVISVSYPIY